MFPPGEPGVAPVFQLQPPSNSSTGTSSRLSGLPFAKGLGFFFGFFLYFLHCTCFSCPRTGGYDYCGEQCGRGKPFPYESIGPALIYNAAQHPPSCCFPISFPLSLLPSRPSKLHQHLRPQKEKSESRQQKPQVNPSQHRATCTQGARRQQGKHPQSTFLCNKARLQGEKPGDLNQRASKPVLPPSRRR